MIFPSTIINSASEASSHKKIIQICRQLKLKFNPNNPDIFIINHDTGWGIDRIRQIKNFLSQKPLQSKNKLVIIHQANLLLPEAQNALLKTLEEPGPNNYLILTTPNHRTLLPTIISRCRLYQISQTSQNPTAKIIIPPSAADTALRQADNLSLAKEEIVPFLKEQLYLHQQSILTNPKPESIKIIAKIIKSLSLIKANVDPRQALDYFFLA